MESEVLHIAHGKVGKGFLRIIHGEKENVLPLITRYLQTTSSKRQVTTHGGKERELHHTILGEKAKEDHLIIPGGKEKEHLSRIFFSLS